MLLLEVLEQLQHMLEQLLVKPNSKTDKCWMCSTSVESVGTVSTCSTGPTGVGNGWIVFKNQGKIDRE